MNNSAVEVFLNRFPVKRLTEAERTVQTYTYTFNPSPESGKEYSAINRITWNIGTPGVRFGSTIITKQPIADRYLQGENWLLKPQGTQSLDLNKSNEREALERLERRWLGWKLRQTPEKYRFENASEGGFIWWNADKIILQGLGWEVHTGVCLDLALHHSGVMFAEIDIHHRFYTSWTLEQWLQTHSDLPINWVRNTYDDRSWKFERISNENPQTVMIPSGSLADYHRNLSKNPATETEISQARVVYVSSKGKELTHLSTRLRPSITMEILSCLQERGSKEAAKVFKQIRQSTQVRFDLGKDTVKWLTKRILLLRDGIVQCDEFESSIAILQQDHIAVDLLGVRKSGAGRMAVIPYQSEKLIDVLPGTAVLSEDGETFRIVTSEAKAGGSARPLQVVRDYGDAPLEILARQIDRLCLLNPASGYSFSRLPYVIHFADKMAKTVQRIGEVGILQGIDRQKIFFA